MKCQNCGGQFEKRIENYQFAESGLDNVELLGVEVRRCTECGQREVAIFKMKELHAVLAKVLAAKDTLLAPKEIRFLRKHLGFSGRDFADRIGVRAETVSRWENGHEEMSWTYELLLRAMVLLEERTHDYSIKSFDRVQRRRVAGQVRVIAERPHWRPEGRGMLEAAVG